MAIETNFKTVQEKYIPRYWDSINEFEEYYLRRLSEKLSDTNYYTDRNRVEKKIPPIDHHPELKEYEVWMEGYAATGESGSATLIGKTKARNFAQACHIVMCKTHLEWMEKENDPSYTNHCDAGRWDYDPNELSYWGCGLYWSEDLARKTFN